MTTDERVKAQIEYLEKKGISVTESGARKIIRRERVIAVCGLLVATAILVATAWFVLQNHG